VVEQPASEAGMPVRIPLTPLLVPQAKEEYDETTRHPRCRLSTWQGALLQGILGM